MKRHSLSLLFLGLVYALLVSKSAHGSVTPTQSVSTQISLKKALAVSGEEGARGFIGSLPFTICAFAYSRMLPQWRFSSIFRHLSDPEVLVRSCATTFFLRTLYLRHKNQLAELCGDEDTAQTYLSASPLLGLIFSTHTCCIAGLALIAGLHTREWLSKKKIKPTYFKL